MGFMSDTLGKVKDHSTFGKILLPGQVGANGDLETFYRKAQDPGGVFNQAGEFQATAPEIQYSPNGADYQGTITRAQQQGLDAYGQGTATAARQSALADQLEQQAAGKGPSLAQLQLQQATQANAAQAASSVASQKGINPALAARMIMQNQQAANQQAAGQSAMTRMQEQMAARSMLGSALSAQRGQDISQQNASAQLMGSAGQLQGQQNQLGLTQAAENARLKMQAQQINAQTAVANMQAQQGMLGGLLGGIGGAMAQGSSGSGSGGGSGGGGGGGMAYGGEVGDDIGKIDSAISPDDGIKTPEKKEGLGSVIGAIASLFPFGGEVPGRARAAGDSPTNDTVPAMLSPGEIVLPRTVAQSEDAPERAAKFVEAVRRHNGGADGYANLLAQRRALSERLGRVNAMLAKKEEP